MLIHNACGIFRCNPIKIGFFTDNERRLRLRQLNFPFIFKIERSEYWENKSNESEERNTYNFDAFLIPIWQQSKLQPKKIQWEIFCIHFYGLTRRNSIFNYRFCYKIWRFELNSKNLPRIMVHVARTNKNISLWHWQWDDGIKAHFWYNKSKSEKIDRRW